MRLKTFALCSTALIAAAASAAGAQTSTPAGGAASSDQTPVANPATASQPQTDTGTPADRASPTVAPSDEAARDGADVVVTGFRESLASTRNIKRNATQQIDAIVAEDIGKLPDLAVSDTAARIPGIQVDRLGGEASNVLVRGLPDFATTYNGREIFTAETRVVALQDFPSANIAALEVFKSTSADLVEAGLAGLVNVRSRRPFDFDGLEVAGTVYGLHTTEAGKVTPNGNLLVSDRWHTGIGDMGLLVNLSYTRLSYLDSEPSNTDFIADPTINGQQVRLPDIQRLYYRSGTRTRPSANVAFQWRPSDKLEFYAEGLYQGFRNAIDDRQLEVPLYAGASYSNIVLRPGTNLVQSGTVTASPGALFSFQGGTFNKTDTYQYAVGAIYDSGPLRVTADLARTQSTFIGSTESVDRVLQGGQTVNFDLNTPQFNIVSLNPADPANYVFRGLYEEAQRSEGGDYQGRIDAEYKLDSGLIRSLKLGLRYTDRDARREFGNRYAAFPTRNIPQSALPLTIAPIRPGFVGTDVQPFRTFLAPTYDSIRDNLTQLRQFIVGLGAPDPNSGSFGTYTTADVAPNPDSVYNAKEKTYAGYAQVGFAFGDLADGVIGVRAVRTEVGVNGTTLSIPANGGAATQTPVSAEQKFTDWLPNANLRIHIAQPLQLRLSATQTRTKPTFAQLNPSANLGQAGTQVNPTDPFANARRGGSGNPNLQPLTSNNYDASLEYYFSRTGFISGAVFRRDLRGFIQNQDTRVIDPVLGPLILTQPINSGKGRIDGAEVQISTFLDFAMVPRALRNFGVQANYTYLDAKTGFPDANGAFTLDRILGVSKHTYNIDGLYENGPVSLRLSYNKRGSYLNSRQDRGDDLYLEEAHPAGRLDLSTNLTFNKHATLFFDATNLLNTPFRVDFSSARAGAPRADFVRFLRYEEQTFSVGLRLRR